MGSDEDYAAFLDKANQDTGGASTSSSKPAGTTSVNTGVPSALKSIDAYYTSDADEPFEPVALKYDGEELPSAKEFGELVGKKGKVEGMGEKELKGYEEVVEKVKEVGNGEVGFFRVELGGTRSEVWVVTVDGKGKLLGVKAVAVMS